MNAGSGSEMNKFAASSSGICHPSEDSGSENKLNPFMPAEEEPGTAEEKGRNKENDDCESKWSGDVVDVESGNSDYSEEEKEVQLKPAREKIKDLLSSDGSMNVRTREGYIVRIENVFSEYEADRPKQFQSSRAEWMWDAGTYINLLRLKTEIKINGYVPDDAVVLVDEKPLGPVKESIEERRKEVEELKKGKIKALSDEYKVMKIICGIRAKIPLNNPKLDEALQLMESLVSMDITALMLLKNPYIVNTFVYLCNYHGPRQNDMTDEEKVNVTNVKELARKLINRFEALFCVPPNTSFATYYRDEIASFWKLHRYDWKRVINHTSCPLGAKIYDTDN